jgi:hypothetical protein
MLNWVWWCILLIPVLGGHRQVDLCESEASWVYVVSSKPSKAIQGGLVSKQKKEEEEKEEEGEKKKKKRRRRRRKKRRRRRRRKRRGGGGGGGGGESLKTSMPFDYAQGHTQ